MATATLLGIRNTVTASGYQSRTADAAVVDTGLPAGSSLTNNDQVGASLAVTHKLTPSYTLLASADWSRISFGAGLRQRADSPKDRCVCG